MVALGAYEWRSAGKCQGAALVIWYRGFTQKVGVFGESSGGIFLWIGYGWQMAWREKVKIELHLIEIFLGQFLRVFDAKNMPIRCN